MHGLPTRIHYHVLQVLSGHAIQGCNCVQAASKVCLGLPADRAKTNTNGVEQGVGNVFKPGQNCSTILGKEGSTQRSGDD